jgi:histone H3/H4
MSGADYSRALARVAVAQIAELAGFDAAHDSAVDILADLLQRYLANVCGAAHEYAELAGRTSSNALDTLLALEDLGVSPDELNTYCGLVLQVRPRRRRGGEGGVSAGGLGRGGGEGGGRRQRRRARPAHVLGAAAAAAAYAFAARSQGCSSCCQCAVGSIRLNDAPPQPHHTCALLPVLPFPASPGRRCAVRAGGRALPRGAAAANGAHLHGPP